MARAAVGMDQPSLKQMAQKPGGVRSRGAVHRRIREALLELIETPDYGPGDKIPSERDLAARHGASRMTVRGAIDELVEAGVLLRDGTSGTRVAVPRIVRPMLGGSGGITEMVQHVGGRPGSRLLHFEQMRASRRVAERLAIAEGAELVVIRRLRTIDDVAFCIETSYLAADRVPGLVASDLMGDQSLWALLRTRYGVLIGSDAEAVLSVAPATAMETRFLRLEAGSPVLLLRSLGLEANGQPVEYLTSVNHPQLVVFRGPLLGARPGGTP